MMKRILLTLLLLWPTTAGAQDLVLAPISPTEPTGAVVYWYLAQINRIVDADTIDVSIYLGINIEIKERLRLYRIDAWEVRGSERPKGLKATAYVKSVIPVGTMVMLNTLKDKRGKYGRILADVWHQGKCINDLLVSFGHAEYKNY